MPTRSRPRPSGIELVAQVTPEDLERYGMIPELIGRLAVIATLGQLSEADLARILTEPKDALAKQYRVLFHYDGAKLAFDDAAIREIAKRAKVQRHREPAPSAR